MGDLLISHDGQLLRIDAIHSTLQIANVYNLRVADYHTYFVGCDEWGWSVWAHNVNCGVDRKIHKFADGAEVDSVVVTYRFKKGDLTDAQRALVEHKYPRPMNSQRTVTR